MVTSVSNLIRRNTHTLQSRLVLFTASMLIISCSTLSWYFVAHQINSATDALLRNGALLASQLAATTLVPAASPPTPLDLKHIETLDTLMTIDHLYREPSQSVGSLANRMGLPEHKLRRLINHGLGHRNFSAFLNTYRLADARRWLADPAQRDTPILTIAMDAGFQSIGPFYRAFKAETGVTPSEFRRLGCQLLAPELRADLAESGIG